MLSPWALPTSAVIGGKIYAIHADYRDILEIFSYFDDPNLPEYLRWQIALALFYEPRINEEDAQEAMEYLLTFIGCGRSQEVKPGPKLLDWQQDADMIVADVNRVSGQEVRGLPFVHWWTFMAWFNAIGEGQLSTVVAIRDKLRKGKKLEKWEKDFYRENKNRVDIKKRYSDDELAQQARLQRMLDGKEEM